MAEVRAFEAIRYDHHRSNGDLSDLIAPPYDVLSLQDKDALLARNDRNFVALDLPHVPPSSAGPADVYEASAGRLKDWLSDGTLVREDRPALYVYHQVFEHAGKQFTRRKFIARVRLVPFDEGVVLPHEEIFGGPKEDRLALTKATRCNMSSIFALYSDSEGEIDRLFAAGEQREPDAVGGLQGVDNRFWIVRDEGVITAVTAAMACKRIFIADGHHRYVTALDYLRFLTESEGPLPPEHPANFVMMVLGSMNDPGCLILPYNRVLTGSDARMDRILDAWKPGCEAADSDSADLVLCDGKGVEEPVRFTARERLRALEPGRSAAWGALDYAYLHRYLIEELAGDLDVSVRYVKRAERARPTAAEEGGVALLTRATPLEHLRAVSEAGELMPQKSTYFYPKVVSGLTVNPLS